MDYFSILLVSVGLAMDSFAVSMASGIILKRFKWGAGLKIALFMGGFQALMPTVGFWVGQAFQKYIEDFDHWIAFGLLVILGVKMILEGRKEEEKRLSFCPTKTKVLVFLAIATSIDALAVGLSFSFLEASFIKLVSTIGITTFIISLLGVWGGAHFGKRTPFPVEYIGGVILILIGTKILLEHTLGISLTL